MSQLNENKYIEDELESYRLQLEKHYQEKITQLEKTAQKYQLMSDYCNDWEVWCQDEEHWLYCSPACEHYTGYRAEEFINNPALFFDIIHREDKEKTKTSLEIAFQQKKILKHRFRIHHKNGQLRWLDYISQPVYDNSGIYCGRRSSSRDVTSREEVYQKLLIAQSLSETAKQAKSDFLSNITHEIKTPLNAISGMGHLLKQSLIDVKQSQKLDIILDSSNQLMDLFNHLLDLSKLESSQVVLEKNNFHIDQIFEYIEEKVSPQVRAKKLDLKFHHNNAIHWLKGDEVRLRQALLNYVTNAIKFTDKGVISITARLVEQQHSHITLRMDVEDSGTGIDPDKLDNLFNIFEQQQQSTNHQHPGIGTGLSITKKIAQLMRGNVGVFSEPSRGSLFWFTAQLENGVPMHDKALPSSQQHDHHQYNYQDTKILVVDDNDINREATAELLERHGIMADVASDGRVAVDKVQYNHYDLILMDIQMPVMDGIQASREILTHYENNELPIVALTANILEEDRLACIAAGVIDYVAKPVNPQSLFSSINRWLPKNKQSHSQIA